MKDKSYSEGFSFIEVLVSLFIISMISMLLYFAYSLCLKTYNRSKEEIKITTLRANTDYILRKKIEKVTIPYWEKEYIFSFTDNSISLNWIDGKNDLIQVLLPENVKVIDVELIQSKENKYLGMKVSYELLSKKFEAKEREESFSFSFSSFGLLLILLILLLLEISLFV